MDADHGEGSDNDDEVDDEGSSDEPHDDAAAAREPTATENASGSDSIPVLTETQQNEANEQTQDRVLTEYETEGAFGWRKTALDLTRLRPSLTLIIACFFSF